MNPKVEFINSKYIIVTLYKKVWYKKNPISKEYIFRGKCDSHTNELIFNWGEKSNEAEIAIIKFAKEQTKNLK